MPQVDPSRAFPGAFGKDYRFVSYGGKVYVVYFMPMAGGKNLQISWRLSDEDAKALGVKQGKIQHISQAGFKNLHFFGDWSEVRNDVLPEEHPFKTYLRKLHELHGNVSWLQDDQFLSVMMMGWAEGWSEAELQKRLERTHWYQSRTDRQRAWEMDLNTAQRKAETKTWTTQVSDALREMYGVGFDLADQGITQQQIGKWATDIASGKWGDPGEGFQLWLSSQQHKAEGIEGTPAWISMQNKLEEQRQFANRPEDKFQDLRTEARYWLGPMGVPSDDTLKRWADDLTTGKSSDADWKQFIQKRASKLYPYLDAETPWQEFADPYKATLEKLWGKPVNWDHPLLQSLGATDANGKDTAAPLSFHQFELNARQDPQFWEGPVARQEGFDLYQLLNQTFTGVTG